MSSSGGGCPASRTVADAAGQVEPVTIASVAKISGRVALADQHLLERGQDRVVGHAGQHQRPPGHPQLDPERRLVHAVPADVADDQVPAGRSGLHHVEEVAADSSARAGPGGRRCRTGRPAVVISGWGSRPRSSRADSACSQLDLAQPAGVLVGPLALDRVADRAGQQHPVDLPLDQVVLGALGHRLGAEVARRRGRSARRPRRPARLGSSRRSPSRPAARRAGPGRAGRSRRLADAFAAPRRGVVTTVISTRRSASASSSRTRNASASSSSTSRTRRRPGRHRSTRVGTRTGLGGCHGCVGDLSLLPSSDGVVRLAPRYSRTPGPATADTVRHGVDLCRAGDDGSVSAPATSLDLPVRTVQRRTLTVLVATQMIGGIGVAIGIAVGALLAESLGGTAISGLGQSALVIGAAVLALPVTPGHAGVRAAARTGAGLPDRRRRGRRGARSPPPGGSVLWLLIGLVLFGGGNAAQLPGPLRGGRPGRAGPAGPAALLRGVGDHHRLGDRPERGPAGRRRRARLRRRAVLRAVRVQRGRVPGRGGGGVPVAATRPAADRPPGPALGLAFFFGSASVARPRRHPGRGPGGRRVARRPGSASPRSRSGTW